MLAAVGMFEFAIIVALFIGFFGGIALALFLRIMRGKGSRGGRGKD
ncbi:MAG: hypothetical protein NTX40_10510 [Planctomycetota bacterium]|jgi:hypothetical protein|nr:hypothetical protein [Planctomycetota bacterium]